MRPFRTSLGTTTEREVTSVRVTTATAAGWAECAADRSPLSSAEFLGGSDLVIRDHLIPRLRALGVSFGGYLGAVHDTVPAGVSVGITDSIEELLEAVAGYLAEGYLRIKLKIEPGWDLEPVRAVRERFGDEMLLQVAANTAYTLVDARHLARLDPVDLLQMEQPLREDDLLGHAHSARRIRTPICLDESIVSARDAATAITLGGCSIINVKPASARSHGPGHRRGGAARRAGRRHGIRHRHQVFGLRGAGCPRTRCRQIHTLDDPSDETALSRQ